MRVITVDRFSRWTHGTELVALAALAWVVFVPGGGLWTAVLGAGLIGSAAATAVLVHRPSIPSLAQVIASAEAEPVAGPTGSAYECGGGLRPRGEREP
jgi:hypothetical protein